MKKEIWKNVKGYEGLYQVSNLGRIKSLSRVQKKGNVTFTSKEKILKTKYHNGYEMCNLYRGNEKSKNNGKYIHRLVAEAFLSNPNKLPCVNHINGIKTDNFPENLEWCTYEDNNLHAVKTNLNIVNLDGFKATNELAKHQYAIYKDRKLLAKIRGSNDAAKFLIENSFAQGNHKNVARAIRSHSLSGVPYNGLLIKRVRYGISTAEQESVINIIKDGVVLESCHNSIEAADFIIKYDGTWNAKRKTIERSIRQAIKTNKQYHGFFFEKI